MAPPFQDDGSVFKGPADGRLRLVDGHGQGLDRRELGQDAVGNDLAHPFDEVIRRPFDDGLDDAIDGAVVNGLRQVVGLAGPFQIRFQYQVDVKGLAMAFFFRQTAMILYIFFLLHEQFPGLVIGGGPFFQAA